MTKLQNSGEPDAAQLEGLERLHTTVEQVLGTIDEQLAAPPEPPPG